MGPRSWIAEFLKMFGPENFKTLLVINMQKRRVMVCTGNSKIDEVDIGRGISQGTVLSTLVFVLGVNTLSMILRTVQAAYEFSESKEKIDRLLFMNDLKLFSRSEKLISPGSTVFLVMGLRNEVWNGKLYHVSTEERQHYKGCWYRTSRW